MKKVFIPKGTIVRHECLYTDRLIVKGVLLVSGKIHAKEILGSGVIEAGEIVCDDVRADAVTVGFLSAKRVAVNKLFVNGECWASESVAVSDFAGAAYVSTGKLIVARSDIRAFDADEVVMLTRKKRGLLGLLWASWWRSFFVSLFYGGNAGEGADEPSDEPADTQASADTNEKKPVPGNDNAA